VEGTHRADERGDQGRGLSDPAAVWGGASYERIAEAFRPVHERIVATLAPQPDERFLDLACGTGGVALVAARTGADVTGLDISPDQVAKARAAAAEAGLPVHFDEGDCERLPYEDGSFDVAASAFGMIFAPDHARAAAELARVCRRGARVAITSWLEDDWHRLNSRLRPDYENTASRLWGEEAHVRELLPEFRLEFGRGESTIAASSPEELWELLASSVPTLKGWLESLGTDEREDVGRKYRQLLGGGRLTREYVLIVGWRR
jgi:SAM-dependent methyltransferase